MFRPTSWAVAHSADLEGRKNSNSVHTLLGPYEIVSALGAGGMGEVYRARDTKLRCEVAIKVISESFTHDSVRIARFQNEAQLLAALNRPHIATIHGLEESAGSQCLFMELVNGDTLAERLKTGPIPMSEALRGRALNRGRIRPEVTQ